MNEMLDDMCFEGSILGFSEHVTGCLGDALRRAGVMAGANGAKGQPMGQLLYSGRLRTRDPNLI